MTLNKRFVGVTAGLGTPKMLSCTGSSNTAPDTPTGVVNTEITAPAVKPISNEEFTRIQSRELPQARGPAGTDPPDSQSC